MKVVYRGCVLKNLIFTFLLIACSGPGFFQKQENDDVVVSLDSTVVSEGRCRPSVIYLFGFAAT